jgi:hypothetical protein
MNIKNNRTLSEYEMCSCIKVAPDTRYIARTRLKYILLAFGEESDTTTTTTTTVRS